MGKNNKIKVHHLPMCDFCLQGREHNDAHYDGRTNLGPWANMCEEHFEAHGIGLGVGRGQWLVLEYSTPKLDDSKVQYNLEELLEMSVVDGCIECPKCGCSFEPDALKCGECGFENPVRAMGMI